MCRRCGYNHSSDHRCPAEGKHCNFSHGIGHFERVCFKKLRQSKPTTNLITSNTVDPALESSAVVSQIGSKTETVLVRVSINKCACKVMRFIVDTGSDWCVIGPQNLHELGLTPSCLQTPTVEMCNTVTATREQMLTDGYIDARLSYGCKQADSKLVVFKNTKIPLLSVDVLQQLNIVVINLTESSVSPPEHAYTSLNRVSLSDSSILLPFDSDLVFLNTELHCCSSKTNDARIHDAELLRQHLVEEFHDVFESQPPMKGEQFNFGLKDNAGPCCASKARPTPIAYQKALRNELDELLREGIITPVTEATEWVNPYSR